MAHKEVRTNFWCAKFKKKAHTYDININGKGYFKIDRKHSRCARARLCVCVCVCVWTQFFCSGFGKIQTVENTVMNTETGII
jgi:hypothetical protein